jgi:hypothetical protein
MQLDVNQNKSLEPRNRRLAEGVQRMTDRLLTVRGIHRLHLNALPVQDDLTSPKISLSFLKGKVLAVIRVRLAAMNGMRSVEKIRELDIYSLLKKDLANLLTRLCDTVKI